MDSGKRNFKIKYVLIGILIFYIGLLNAEAQWRFDWNTRTDINGKTAGIFEVTPFPIYESTESIAIKNDEHQNGKVFLTGNKIYVDGNLGNDLNDGLSFDKPKKTIGKALQQIEQGQHHTILIRGAYGSFDGIYRETIKLNGKSGKNDQERLIIAGYGQERPVIDGSNGLEPIIISSNSSADRFITLLRLKIQNSQERGIILFGKQSEPRERTGFINIIDVWIRDTSKGSYVGNEFSRDGNLHTLYTEHIWIYHCTSEHTYGKCYKISADSDYPLVEWSIARECGHWQGMAGTSDVHPYGFDFAADGVSDDNKGIILRYNLSGTTLMGNEIRYSPDYDIHHNEFYDPIHTDDYQNEKSSWDSSSGFMIRGTNSYGKFHSNIIHGNTDRDRPYLVSLGYINNSYKNSFYNNILFDNLGDAFNVNVSPGYEVNIEFYNNTILASNDSILINIGDRDISDDSKIIVKNNIVLQGGNGKCVKYAEMVDSGYNQYFSPYGTIGIVELRNGDVELDPGIQWEAGDPFSVGAFRPGSPISGTDVSHLFNLDLVNNRRVNWTIGAIEDNNIVRAPNPPVNLIVIENN